MQRSSLRTTPLSTISRYSYDKAICLRLLLRQGRDVYKRQDLEGPQEEYLHFSAIWRDVYRLFNERLAALGVAYRAAAYRLVAGKDFTEEDLLRALSRHSGSKISLVTFVGLYNLTPAEQTIIKKLQRANADALKVQLYWQRVSLDATDEFTEHLYRTIGENVRLLGGCLLYTSRCV